MDRSCDGSSHARARKTHPEDVERGPYRNADEFLERAVHLLHEQEEWFAANREEIGARIEEGYASAQRGELTDDDQVKTEMEQKKRAWRLSHRTT